MLHKLHFSNNYNSISDGQTCYCKTEWDKFTSLQRIMGSQLSKKPHLYFAHYSLETDGEKSKYTGITTPWSCLGSIVQTTTDNGGDPLDHWVHQPTPDRTDKFGFRYSTKSPNGEICGMFYAEGKIWYQDQLEWWYSTQGLLESVFPAGPGVSGDKTREWAKWPQDTSSEECTAATKGIWCWLEWRSYG